VLGNIQQKQQQSKESRCPLSRCQLKTTIVHEIKLFNFGQTTDYKKYKISSTFSINTQLVILINLAKSLI